MCKCVCVVVESSGVKISALCVWRVRLTAECALAEEEAGPQVLVGGTLVWTPEVS